jgi:hypothetical protein
MTMPSISLQDLRRRIYVTAKADKRKRFWGLYVHVVKLETLRAANDVAKRNNGAPGIDGVTFAAIEAASVLSVPLRWLYRHAKQFTFTRRLSRKRLRFSEAGLRRYLATKKS